MPSFLYTPAPNKDAARFISTKKPVAAEVFYGLLPELRGRAFTISGIENANVLKTARDRIAQLPLGGDWEQIKRGLADDLSPWMDPERAGKRAELLLRVHGFAAYSAAQYQVLIRQLDVFPFWQYQSAEDGKVRPGHAALDGMIVPGASSFWQTHFPPWEFGCRCQIVPLSLDDVADIERADAKRVPEARRVLSGDRLREAESGRLLTAGPGDVPAYIDVRSPRERQDGSGFHHNPGDLSVSLDDLRGRYDPQTWATFEQWAGSTTMDKQGTTVLAWLGGQARPAVLPVAPSRTAASVIADLARVEAETAPEIAQAEAALQRAKATPMPAAGPELEAWFAQRDGAMAALKQARERRLEAGRAAVSLPAEARGAMGVLGSVPKGVRARFDEGTRIVEALVDPTRLAPISVETLKGTRAFYRHANATIHINRGTSASTVAHEIGHAIELGTPEIEQAARAFLARRAGGASPQRLSALTGVRYQDDEVAYEDEWAAKGGDPYMGKVYPRATEIVSMGIERLWADPVGFAQRDPDYFTALLGMLQKAL